MTNVISFQHMLGLEEVLAFETYLGTKYKCKVSLNSRVFRDFYFHTTGTDFDDILDRSQYGNRSALYILEPKKVEEVWVKFMKGRKLLSEKGDMINND